MAARMRTIRTERLRLVPVTKANARALWDVLQEPDLRQYQDLPDVDFDQFLSAVRARPTDFGPGSVGRFEWLMYVDGSWISERLPRAIGWVSLRLSEGPRAAAEIGYSVVQTFRGRGIAREAVSALLEEGFKRAQLRSVRAYCVPENQPSRAVLRRVGFTDEGILPHGATVQGRPVDVIAYTLDRASWETVR